MVSEIPRMSVFCYFPLHKIAELYDDFLNILVTIEIFKKGVLGYIRYGRDNNIT